tara:strand:+ start:1509 stop:1730 length:222 start_codon:yes stop_codon:yes gene_type:complete
MIELVGYIASAITMIGFTRSKLHEVRIISSISCLFWMAYGMLLGLPSVIIMNVSILALQIYKLIKERKDGNRK